MNRYVSIKKLTNYCLRLRNIGHPDSPGMQKIPENLLITFTVLIYKDYLLVF